MDIRPRVQVVGGSGSEFLETFTVRDLDTGAETVESGVLFLLIGSEPRTEWLAGTLACDRWGFLLTGGELAADDVSPAVAAGPATGIARDQRAGGVRRRRRAVGLGQAGGVGGR